MINQISDILGKFTPGQRVIVLCMALVTLLSVILGPQIIENNDCADVYTKLEEQRKDILRLSQELVDVQLNANKERLEREKEIAKIVEMIKTDADNCPLCDHIHLTPYEKDLVKNPK